MEPSPERKANPGTMSYFVLPISMTAVALAAFLATAASSITLAAFSATVLGLLVAVRLWAALGLRRLEVELRCAGDRLFAGEELSLSASISNDKLLPVRFGLDLVRPESLEPLDAEPSGTETSLLPFSKTSGLWRYRAARRGVYRLGPARISAGDPLGLWRKEKVLPFGPEIVVYPRILPLNELVLPYQDYFGIHPSKGVVEDPAWYEGTRDYTGTKPAKHIHWKASARLGSLQEKLFEPTSQRKAFFIFDGSGFEVAMDPEGFEAALELLASLGTRLTETGASVALATDRSVVGQPPLVPLGRGPEHLGSFLELLARCHLERGQDLSGLLRRAGPQGASFIVVAREARPGVGRFFSLPAARRDQLLFVFAQEPPEEVKALYPSTTFAELRHRPEAQA